ncbi:hypothetical protein ACHHYP_04997 [Achlya hypogyna]|uniref:Uncharacterized protein n=1 Tax=Achlya hypogyna TaxID=1202772 RepID=A0A1V9YZB1_ACHHY|nr:hypothetical protein ACHHYP_04997 [Achlya hypogyna]
MASKLDELQQAEAIPLRRKAPPTKASVSAHVMSPSETLAEFLARIRPTSTDASTSHRWIFVRGPAPRPSFRLCDAQKQEVAELLDAWAGEMHLLEPNDVPKHARAVSATVFALAKQYNYGSGKLLVFVEPSRADAVWAAVAIATAQGQLGCSAKISTRRQPGHPHVLSVVVGCFWDEIRMLQILHKLSELGLHVAAFKPDIFSTVSGYDLRRLHLQTLLYNPCCP